jgi:hypothetical protein
MIQREKVDLLWNDSGDISIDELSEDIATTKDVMYRALVQQIQDMVQSTQGDWLLNPEIGCNLGMFAGKPNTAATGAAMKKQVKELLVRRGIVTNSEISVEVFPTSPSQIGLVIFVKPLGTNSTSRLIYSYDMFENKLTLRRP